MKKFLGSLVVLSLVFNSAPAFAIIVEDRLSTEDIGHLQQEAYKTFIKETLAQIKLIENELARRGISYRALNPMEISVMGGAAFGVGAVYLAAVIISSAQKVPFKPIRTAALFMGTGIVLYLYGQSDEYALKLSKMTDKELADELAKKKQILAPILSSLNKS